MTQRAGGHRRTRALAKADYETLSELRYLMRRFAAFSEAEARSAGLTPQQHQALLTIRGFPGKSLATIGNLAERLNLRPHSAVGLVDRLASKGLLRRHVDRADRRKVRVVLTPRSQALLAGLSLAHRDELRRLAPLLRGLLARLGTET
ncbi:MAG TPA: MarR family transcriptional regulator [Steroidobacteraceae bacterium]|nr:MarR family transcriptional regulator [Steroidobacteraceae bacterium]